MGLLTPASRVFTLGRGLGLGFTSATEAAFALVVVFDGVTDFGPSDFSTARSNAGFEPEALAGLPKPATRGRRRTDCGAGLRREGDNASSVL